LDAERAGEGVDGVQGRGGDVLGGVVVLDVTIEPFAAVHPEHVAGVHADGRRDLRVPAVVTEDLLLAEGFRRVAGEHVLGHASPSTAAGPRCGRAESGPVSGPRQPRVARIRGGAGTGGPAGARDPVDDGRFVGAGRGAVQERGRGRAEGAQPGRADPSAQPGAAARTGEVLVAGADGHGALVLVGALAAELVDRHSRLLVVHITSSGCAHHRAPAPPPRGFRRSGAPSRREGILGTCRPPLLPHTPAPISTATWRSRTRARWRSCTRTSGCSPTTTPARSGRCTSWWCPSATSGR